MILSICSLKFLWVLWYLNFSYAWAGVPYLPRWEKPDVFGRVGKTCRSDLSLTCSGLARRSVILGRDFQAHQGSPEAPWTSLSPLADWSQTQSKYFKLQAVTELHLKGAEREPASVAVEWEATFQGARTVRPQHQLQGMGREGDVEDTAAHQLCDKQAAVACLEVGLLWSAVLFRCCVVGSWDSHWHLSSSGLFKIDHCEHHPY